KTTSTCIHAVCQHCRLVVVVWGGISWHTLGPLIKVEQCLNATGYLNIVTNQQLSICKIYFFSRIMPHATRLVQEWFHQHDSEFSLLQWPAESPDLNPIVHLWEEMERAIRSRDPLPANLTQLWEALQSTWSSIPVECSQHLGESMPR
ncbi:hypothetical protein J4Q44_G00051570, partial [Coregonus suidteri]